MSKTDGEQEVAAPPPVSDEMRRKRAEFLKRSNATIKSVQRKVAKDTKIGKSSKAKKGARLSGFLLNTPFSKATRNGKGTSIWVQVLIHEFSTDQDDEYARRVDDETLEANIVEKGQKLPDGSWGENQTRGTTTVHRGTVLSGSMFGTGGTPGKRVMDAGTWVDLTGVQFVHPTTSGNIKYFVNIGSMTKMASPPATLPVFKQIGTKRLDVRPVTVGPPPYDKEDKTKNKQLQDQYYNNATPEEQQQLDYVKRNQFLPILRTPVEADLKDDRGRDRDTSVALGVPSWDTAWGGETATDKTKYVAASCTIAAQVMNMQDPKNMSMTTAGLRVRFMREACWRMLGVTQPEDFAAMAATHVPNMEFGAIAKVDHKRNHEEHEPSDTVDYVLEMIVWRNVFVDVSEYVRANALPVTWAHVCEALGGPAVDGASNEGTAPIKDHPINTARSGIRNLNEYTGSLKEFEDGYELWALTDRLLTSDHRRQIQEWGDAAAERCSKEIFGEGDEVLGLSHGAKYVYYAVKRSQTDTSSRKRPTPPPTKSDTDAKRPRTDEA